MHRSSSTPLLLLLVYLLLPSITMAQNLHKEERTTGPFQAVELRHVGQLIIHAGKPQKLQVESQPEWLPHIHTTTKNGRLILALKTPPPEQRPSSYASIRYLLDLPTLDHLILNGAGQIQLNNLKTPKLSLTAGGAGKITIKALNTKQFQVTLNGATHCEASGHTETQQIKIHGVGSYHAKDLHSQITDIHIAGTGRAVVYSQKSVTANLFGTGSIRYYGQPEQVIPNIHGTGSIAPAKP
ncbi:head GIN domain-containing protein [Magnetococcales bacterium HHB-1]